MNQTIKDKINTLTKDQLANAIGHYTQYTLLPRHEQIMLNMQYRMDNRWNAMTKEMIDYVREVYEEKIKNA